MLTREQITDWFKSLQDAICHELEQADNAGEINAKGTFKETLWQREEGGGRDPDHSTWGHLQGS